MRRIRRALAAVALLVSLVVVPAGQVAACDCALRELPDAIAEADVAIVGTLVAGGVAEPAGVGPGAADPVEYTWAVQRSRGPLDTDRLRVRAMPNDGANCGISFEGDGPWLLLAYESDGSLETNGCLQNTRLDTAPPDVLDIVDTLVSTPVAGEPTGGPAESVPAPVLVGLGAFAVVSATSILAFRRSGPGAAA